MTPEKAEILAFETLGWLAGEPEDLQKFLNISAFSRVCGVILGAIVKGALRDNP